MLAGWPNEQHESIEFEENCAKISALVYTTDKGQPNVEINNANDETLDTLFSRQFRLKTMNDWDEGTFEEHLGRKVSWGIVTGRAYGGASLVSDELESAVNGHVVKMDQYAEQIKKTKGTEEEPFEGEVPLDEVEAAIVDDIY